jgi:hypothetical protein
MWHASPFLKKTTRRSRLEHYLDPRRSAQPGGGEQNAERWNKENKMHNILGMLQEERWIDQAS